MHSEVPKFRQGNWGYYESKPICQIDWERMVKRDISAMDLPTNPKDKRPKLLDQNSGLTILIDSGASASIWPKYYKPFQNLPPDKTRHLQAVNGTKIQTYGAKTMQIWPPHAKAPFFT